MFRALVSELTKIEIAVLRYNRRAQDRSGDVPYRMQLADAQNAVTECRLRLGSAPVGLWGFSQGAWVAMMAAAMDPSIAFLVLVGASTVSPARQMRYGTAEQLRRAGFGQEALDELSVLRSDYEAFHRGQLSRQEAQRRIDGLVERPWFSLAWVPENLPPRPSWVDMDFDPIGTVRQIHCPVLAFYGDDEWVPVIESIDVWQHHLPDPSQLTICQLPGTGHHPVIGGYQTVEAISPRYIETLNSWLLDQLPPERRA